MKITHSKKLSCRALAAQVVAAILQHQGSLSSQLPMALSRVENKDRSLLQDLCYGTLRHVFSLRSLVSQQLEKPLKEKDADVLALLLLGAYQLHHTRIPDHAAINSCVSAASELNKSWAKGLINAVLRNIQRSRENPDTSATNRNDEACLDEAFLGEARFDHPQWLIDSIKTAWPVQAESIFQTNNSKAPMTLRVNTKRMSREDYQQQLGLQSLSAQSGMLSDHALILDSAVDVTKLPLFAEGWVSVQDEAAQLSASLMRLSENLSVLDACAAPGGKTCHLLECETSLRVTALDINEHRCVLIAENLERLKLTAHVIVADATRPDLWWEQQCEGRCFDRILIDAPCSATGVIRHHPDIKWLRKPADITALAETQFHLLSALWPLLKIDGYLLYVTCSILPPENDAVIARFLGHASDAHIETLDVDWGIPTMYGKQLLPQMNGHDGFYFCRIQKSAP